MDNPYAAPETAGDTTASSAPDGAERLFSLTQVGWATFFGTWLAGSILLAANFVQLQKRIMAVIAIGAGLAGTAAYYGLIYALGRPYKLIITVGMTLAMYLLARGLQGRAIADHFARFRGRRSNWLVFAAVMLVLLPSLVAVGLAIASVLAA